MFTLVLLKYIMYEKLTSGTHFLNECVNFPTEFTSSESSKVQLALTIQKTQNKPICHFQKTC